MRWYKTLKWVFYDSLISPDNFFILIASSAKRQETIFIFLLKFSVKAVSIKQISFIVKRQFRKRDSAHVEYDAAELASWTIPYTVGSETQALETACTQACKLSYPAPKYGDNTW